MATRKLSERMRAVGFFMRERENKEWTCAIMGVGVDLMFTRKPNGEWYVTMTVEVETGIEKHHESITQDTVSAWVDRMLGSPAYIYTADAALEDWDAAELVY